MYSFALSQWSSVENNSVGISLGWLRWLLCKRWKRKLLFSKMDEMWRSTAPWFICFTLKVIEVLAIEIIEVSPNSGTFRKWWNSRWIISLFLSFFRKNQTQLNASRWWQNSSQSPKDHQFIMTVEEKEQLIRKAKKASNIIGKFYGTQSSSSLIHISLFLALFNPCVFCQVYYRVETSFSWSCIKCKQRQLESNLAEECVLMVDGMCKMKLKL